MSSDPNKEFARALITMRRIIAFFPKDVETQRIIMSQIMRFVGTGGDLTQRLEWFAQETINRFTRWGDDCTLPSLRALYCTRYDPADGIQPTVVLEGYEENDLEARFRAREMNQYEARLAEWQEQKRLNPADYAPLQLEGPLQKPFPAPERGRQPPAVEKQKPAVSFQQAQNLEKQLAEDLAAAPIRSDEERARIIAEMETKVRRVQ
jgi:hypothetical protein